ncbi:MAG: HAD-IC family P-type ATPase [Patescibacteria group bacterium]|nr:HAD-IC family P-type ATPase [Patescibacteria group bacterium]
MVRTKKARDRKLPSQKEIRKKNSPGKNHSFLVSLTYDVKHFLNGLLKVHFFVKINYMAEILWHNLETKEVAKLQRTNLNEGLSEKEIKSRQKKFGQNKLPEEKPLPRVKIFLSQFKSPLIYILMIAGTITLFLEDYPDAIVIFAAVFLNIIIGFFQENKASQTLRALKKVVKQESEVLREGNLKVVDSTELVPGDLIILKPGDKVPADGKIIESQNLKINEMALTGEWLSAKKSPEVLPIDTPLADRDNMVYRDCLVEEGKGKAIVTETGVRTEIGKIAQIIKEVREEKTPYQKKVIHLSKIIGILIVFISLLIFILGIAAGRDFLQMFLTAVAVAVAAIPEGLPVAITVILALGMQRILRKQGLVRKMIAAETLGSTSIIATDKTATLTQGKMKVSQILGDKFLTLKAAVLTSEAFIGNPQEPKEKWIIRGRPTDKALLEAGIEIGIDQKKEYEKKKIAEMPFNPINKFSAALYEEDGKKNLYICGAPEKILGLSLLKKGEKEELEKKLDKLAKKGLRIVACGYKKFANLPQYATNKIFEKIRGEFVHIRDLNFLGFITLKDPIRKETKEAIKICRQAGMKPIIVTGDHKLTAKAVAIELGLKIKEKDILEGRDLDKLSAQEFEKILPQIQIYSRVEPRHKIRIISAWQEKGEVVAMTGDGVNDAPALKKADIGVALGSGTEVAKETSDLILLNDSFSIIVAAIEEGRVIIDNIRKTVTLLVSQCFSEIILIGVSILVRLPLPILPTQILWENLIEGSPQGISLAFEPKEKGIMERRKPEGKKSPLLTEIIKTIIFGFGIITGFILFGLFLYLLKTGFPLVKIRTIIFAALSIDTLFYAFSCKNLKQNIWRYNLFSNLYLILCQAFSLFMLLIAIYLPPFQILLKTVPLNFFDWQLILGLGFLNIILIEAIKYYFIISEFEKFRKKNVSL